MDIAWFRDLVIIIEGILAIIILIFMGILGWTIFQRVKEIGASAKMISGSVQEVVDSVKSTAEDIASVSRLTRSEIAGPLMKVAAVTQGLSKCADSIMGFVNKFKGGERCE